MAAESRADDAHEGDWFYVSAATESSDDAVGLVTGIARVVQASGRIPLSADGISSATRASRGESEEAVRFAQALIVDVTATSDSVETIVRCALAHDRPIIALRRDGASAGDAVLAELETRDRARVIRYRGTEDCLEQLERTLADHRFWRLVADAAPHDVV
ncbi:MAG TPA: hypothetical protein VG318_04795 [Actinomycetota bacterium]|nr:hypothetical protein [Actinomycetota bacterium]